MLYNEENMNINLCLSVKKYPCLYDNTLEDYGNTRKGDKAWETIGRELGLSGEILCLLILTSLYCTGCFQA